MRPWWYWGLYGVLLLVVGVLWWWFGHTCADAPRWWCFG